MDPVYFISPLILIAVVLAAVWLDRWSVPVILVALGGGILGGKLGLGHLVNYATANHVAKFALVFILFNGGFGIPRRQFARVALPAGGMAVWGVILTAGLTFVVLWKLLGWPFEKSILIAAIISSTDAAATLSILRRYTLPKRLANTLIIESAANDPMAVLLTVVAVQFLSSGTTQGWSMAPMFMWSFAGGPLVGWVMGRAAAWLFTALRPQERGHYYVLFFGVVLLTYGLAEQCQASGMLAVFIAGYVMGNRPFVYKQGVDNFSAAFASVANIATFVLLGLLVSPKAWTHVWLDGLLLFLFLTFFSRPLALLLGTAGMKIKKTHQLFMIWAGLRGAVPIILATYPAAAELPGSQDIFNLVFFAVMLSVLFQGSTLGLVARLLKLLSPRSQSEPLYNLDLITMAPSDMDLVLVSLPEKPGFMGVRIQDLRLPPETVITLITRGATVISPNGPTRLESGDHVTILTHMKNAQTVRQALLTPFQAD